jgi:hypothetical protein
MPSRFNQLIEPNKYVSQYVPLPLELIAAQGAAKQKEQDAGKAEALEIGSKKWNMLSQDVESSKMAKEEINKTLDEFSNKDFTDPSTKMEWYKKKRELSDRFGSLGDIGNIQANYDAYKAYEKDILDKSKELGWSQDELRAHLNQTKKSFQGTIADDKTFNIFEGQGLANYVDENKWASEVLKDVAADTGVSKLRNYGSLNQVTQAFASGELDHKDYNKIINSLALRAQGDSKLKSSLEQQGLFRGQEGWSNFIEGQDKDGNIVLNTNTPFGKILSGVGMGAQYQREKENYMKVVDPLMYYNLKKASDEEDLQKQMQFSLQGIPVDPSNPTNNDSGINSSLRSSGDPLSKQWEFKNGKLTMKEYSPQKDVFVYNGKEYNSENMPKEYNARWTLSKSNGKQFIVDDKGQKFELKERPNTDQFAGFKTLIETAKRLGVDEKSDRETMTKAVEDYYLKANNFQMNFPRFDEGTIRAISQAFGVKTTDDGKITNPGKLSFSSIKTLDGNLIGGEDLSSQKATILNGAKILGPVQSLTNENYKSGDMYIQSTDGSIYIMNTNDKTINNALNPANVLTKSINNYIAKGVKSLTAEENAKVENTFGKENAIVGAVKDDNDNYYYVDSKMNVMVLHGNDQPVMVGLDEANKMISENNMRKILPTYNVKNFNRVSQADELGQIIAD